MTELRQRIYRVTVGTIRVGAPAHVTYEIDRSVDHHAGTAIAQIWNLSLAHQRALEQSADQQLVIEGGHESTGRGLEKIFSGRVARSGRGGGDAQPSLRTEVTSVDAVSRVEGTDGGTEYQQARTSRSWGPGVSPGTVLRALVEDLGVGVGNLDEAEQLANASGVRFDEGYVAGGQASRRITTLLAGVGLRWSIQHGVFQAMRGNEPVQATAVRLAPSTGLIGSPEPASHGRVKASAIMSSDIWPGRAVVLESARTNGRFTVRSMKGKFDSHGRDNQFELELAA